MKKLLTNKYILLIADALLIPGMFLCELLSDLMLSQYSECPWVRLGGKCITCGGTHFVNSLLNGRIAEAIDHNLFLFVVLILMILVWILLHLDRLLGIKWAKTLLKGIFSIPFLIVLVVFMLGFFFARNYHLFVRIAMYIDYLIRSQ